MEKIKPGAIAATVNAKSLVTQHYKLFPGKKPVDATRSGTIFATSLFDNWGTIFLCLNETYRMTGGVLQIAFKAKTTGNSHIRGVIVTIQPGSISSAIRKNVRQIELFSTLSDDEIDILIRHSKIRSLGEDETLFLQGDESDFFVVIIDGRIEITKFTSKETPVSLASLTKGNTLGEMALFDQEQRSASATATEPTMVLILSRTSFDQLIDQHPRCGTKLLRKLATILCSHLRNTSRMFAETIEPNLLT